MAVFMGEVIMFTALIVGFLMALGVLCFLAICAFGVCYNVVEHIRDRWLFYRRTNKIRNMIDKLLSK